MKKTALIGLLVSFLLPTIALASCPELNKVVYRCVVVAGKKHCQWSAPWWEGYQGRAEMGEHPVSFLMAFWGRSSDPTMGSVNCFYRDKRGELVELSQNNWGGIPKPTSSLWRDGAWPNRGGSMIGRICDESVTTCVFHYGV